MKNYWEQNIEESVQSLASDADKGLSHDEAEKRLAEHGPNQLAEKKGQHPFFLFIGQFNDFIVWVLLGAAVVSGFLQEWVDALAIAAIVALNAAMGFIQEFKAEKSLAALKKMAMPFCRVTRDGERRQAPTNGLVPGDLIELEAGDHVPADCRLVWATANFTVQEASLTGESTAVRKSTASVDNPKAPLGDRTCMLYMGTAVAAGRARAVVAFTGMKTELGRIAGMLQEAGGEETPLQKKLEEFGKWLVYLCGVLVALVFLINLWRASLLPEGITKEVLVQMFLTAVSLAVAAIPEGLPAVVTIALALGLQRMVKRHALIRKLPSVETLGCASVICSDKTGTLTRNEMTVQHIHTPGRTYAVKGIGYAPEGSVELSGKRAVLAESPDLELCLTVGMLCNSAELAQVKGAWKITGDPTEGALLTAGAKAGLSRKALEGKWSFVEEIPFDSDRKLMTVVRQGPLGLAALVKGAPDVLLSRCDRIHENGRIRPITEADRTALTAVNDGLAEMAMRVLGCAIRVFDAAPQAYEAAAVEQSLVFCGFLAMIDPPREEVKAAIAACRTAGIRTVMITGDHKKTAVAIARALGAFDEGSMALTGTELDALDEKAFDDIIERVPVYARVAPEHKFRIVRAWRKKGHVVAMTGDGVNDAPAVREADIGVAMGITGTDVTKEVSDMVVTDDNFTSIVAAVEEGRGIYDNIQKFIHYLLSCNAGEIIVMFLSALIGMPVPLLPIQILWVNLVTDGLPALALGVDPVDKKIMLRRPRDMKERVVGPERVWQILGQGFVIACCSLTAFSYIYYFEGRHTLAELFSALFAFDGGRLADLFTVPEGMREDLLGKARTVGFIVLAFCQDFQSYNCRNQTESLFKIGPFTNMKLIGATTVSIILNLSAIYLPFFQTVLKTRPLTGIELLIVLVAASIPFWAMEAYKLVKRKRAG